MKAASRVQHSTFLVRYALLFAGVGLLFGFIADPSLALHLSSLPVTAWILYPFELLVMALLFAQGMWMEWRTPRTETEHWLNTAGVIPTLAWFGLVLVGASDSLLDNLFALRLGCSMLGLSSLSLLPYSWSLALSVQSAFRKRALPSREIAQRMALPMRTLRSVYGSGVPLIVISCVILVSAIGSLVLLFGPWQEIQWVVVAAICGGVSITLSMGSLIVNIVASLRRSIF